MKIECHLGLKFFMLWKTKGFPDVKVKLNPIGSSIEEHGHG